MRKCLISKPHGENVAVGDPLRGFFDWSWESGIERRGRQTGCLKKLPSDQMLVLEPCYNIFRVESATLSILNVKGDSLHDCSNVFSLWNFCVHLTVFH